MPDDPDTLEQHLAGVVFLAKASLNLPSQWLTGAWLDNFPTVRKVPSPAGHNTGKAWGVREAGHSILIGALWPFSRIRLTFTVVLGRLQSKQGGLRRSGGVPCRRALALDPDRPQILTQLYNVVTWETLARRWRLSGTPSAPPFQILPTRSLGLRDTFFERKGDLASAYPRLRDCP